MCVLLGGLRPVARVSGLNAPLSPIRRGRELWSPTGSPPVQAGYDVLRRDMGDMPVTAAPLVQRQQHGAISYYSSEHEALPHVVKFSGGRSSAMMTFRLAEAGALRPERGDVVLFANTSAEHPGTYAFTRECKERLEREYRLPFPLVRVLHRRRRVAWGVYAPALLSTRAQQSLGGGPRRLQVGR